MTGMIRGLATSKLGAAVLGAAVVAAMGTGNGGRDFALAGSSHLASGTLQLNARFAVKWNSVASCPPGTPVTLACYVFVGNAVVPGLGRVTGTYTKTFDGNFSLPCVHTLPTAVIVVAGKGELNVSMTGPECESLPPAQSLFDSTFTGGSGRFAGASGRVQVKSSVSETGGGEGRAFDTWTGTLTVPGLDFDVTGPTLQGAGSRTVLVPKNAKRVRVRYTVMAQDAIDGSVAVACTPRSGTFFKPGRTRVTCSATDSSGNTSQARFTVTVRRSRPV